MPDLVGGPLVKKWRVARAVWRELRKMKKEGWKPDDPEQLEQEALAEVLVRLKANPQGLEDIPWEEIIQIVMDILPFILQIILILI